MQNLENLDVFEILIKQKLLKCPQEDQKLVFKRYFLSIFEWPLFKKWVLLQLKIYTCCVKLYAHAYLRTRRYAPV